MNPKTIKAGKLALVTAGAKGGVGKTGAIVGIVDFYNSNGITTTKIDCDVENRRKGGFSSFYPDAAKHDIHGERGLDDTVNTILESPNQIAVVDLGAGSGAATFKWFGEMGQVFGEFDINVTLVCALTANPAAITGVFTWAGTLGKTVRYLVVKNQKDGNDFSYLHESEQGMEFERVCKPTYVTMANRMSQIQAELDNRSLSVRQALEGSAELRGPLLSRGMDLSRLRTYLTNFNRELESAKALLLP